jgi:hypothetical protein
MNDGVPVAQAGDHRRVIARADVAVGGAVHRLVDEPAVRHLRDPVGYLHPDPLARLVTGAVPAPSITIPRRPLSARLTYESPRNVHHFSIHSVMVRPGTSLHTSREREVGGGAAVEVTFAPIRWGDQRP